MRWLLPCQRSWSSIVARLRLTHHPPHLHPPCLQYSALAEGASTADLEPLLAALQAHMSGGSLLRRLLLRPSTLLLFRGGDGSVQAASGRALLHAGPAAALQYGLACEELHPGPAAAPVPSLGQAFAMLGDPGPGPTAAPGPPLTLGEVLEDDGGGLLPREVQQWRFPSHSHSGSPLLIRSRA